MISKNDQTLKVYARHAQFYEDDTLNDFNRDPKKTAKLMENHHAFLDLSLKTIPKNGNLFEVGSGYGRDAIYIRSKGYNIQVSDAVDSFITRLQRDDFAPVKFNLITDEFTEKWQYILVNAVLVHFTKSDVVLAIKKIYDALEPSGIFAFSLKQRAGGGEDWKTDIAGEKRYFSYWDIGEINQVVEDAGFEIVHIKQVGGIRACWLDVIVQKPSKDES
ncbi:MAG: methyltransferase domain-containing protein [Candidatus Saccharimonadales bacterium]